MNQEINSQHSSQSKQRLKQRFSHIMSSGDEQEEFHVIDILNQLYSEDPDTDFIDISGLGIEEIDQFVDIFRKFKNLQELNLSENGLTYLPQDLSFFQSLTIFNLNGNIFPEFDEMVKSLSTIPKLQSLYLNLEYELQVDTVMHFLPKLLEFLNGLKVERDLADHINEYSFNDPLSPNDIISLSEDLNTKSDIPCQVRTHRKQRAHQLIGDGSPYIEQPNESLYPAILQPYSHIIELIAKFEGIASTNEKQALIKDVETQLQRRLYEQLRQNYDTVEEKIVVPILVERVVQGLTLTNNELIGHIIDSLQTVYSQSLTKVETLLKESQAKNEQLTQRFHYQQEQLGLMLAQNNGLNDRIQHLEQEAFQSSRGVQQHLKSQDNIFNGMASVSQLQGEQSPKPADSRYASDNKSPKQVSQLPSGIKSFQKRNDENSQAMPESQQRSTISINSASVNMPSSKKLQESSIKHPIKSENQASKLQSATKVCSTGPIQIPQQPTIPNRVLSLKQLKDTINDIYTCKIKFDKKCEDNKQPRETMEQYMYTYLNQKYGLKSLIVEWAAAIINGVRTFLKEDHDVTLFEKILKNECDEEFRFIQLHVKETMTSHLKLLLKEKHPFKSEVEITRLCERIQGGTMALEEWMWRKTLEKMYESGDYDILILKLNDLIEQKKKATKFRINGGVPYGKHATEATLQLQMLSGNRKLTRDELVHAMTTSSKGQEKLVYSEFSKIVLDYQLHEHLKFLFRFTVVFKMVDCDGNGVLSEEELRVLLHDRMQVIEIDEELNYLLRVIDPYNNQKIYHNQLLCEIVHLLSSHMVPITPDNPLHKVTILEKYVTKLGIDFEQIEMEMNMLDEGQIYGSYQPIEIIGKAQQIK